MERRIDKLSISDPKPIPTQHGLGYCTGGSNRPNTNRTATSLRPPPVPAKYRPQNHTMTAPDILPPSPPGPSEVPLLPRASSKDTLEKIPPPPSLSPDLPPLVEQRVRSRTQRLTMKFREEAQASRRSSSNRRLSISALLSLSGEQDLEVDDDLTRAQKYLKDLKSRISTQSKRNYLLEKDVRYLDSRIALLIQNRMALDEEFGQLIDNDGTEDGDHAAYFPDDRKRQLYGNLFFLLQTEPRIVAHLTRLVTISEMDNLLQTVMFTLYGNQYDNREEHLLLTMFQSVLKYQFDCATDFGSLLRANTPASRMMTTYTRRGPGQQYLKMVLSENLNMLFEQHNDNLEINPLKVYEQMINQIETETGQDCQLPRSVSAEEAAANDGVIAIIAPRLQKLTDLANRFLDTIIASLEQVPYGIRWICKQIMLLTKRKYPESSNWSICSLIGGFFFLRFLNPAIVTPQSYMIVESSPEKNNRRTLTLLAKMLQNLANKPSYSKEMYMMALNPFIENNKERISKFLNDLCKVEDFYESLELDQYMAMTKKDLSINITLNEMYSMNSLLLQHCAVICSGSGNEASALNSPLSPLPPMSHAQVNGSNIAMTLEQSFIISCQHLRSLLNDLGNAPAQLPRAENKSVALSLYARWESAPILFPEMLAAISSKESAVSHSGPASRVQNENPDERLNDTEVLYLDTKSLIVQILRKQAVVAANIQDVHHYENHIYSPQVTVSHVTPHFKTNLIDIKECLEKACCESSDEVTIKRGLRTLQNLRILEDRYRHPMIRLADGYYDLAREIHADFQNLNLLLQKLKQERESLGMVYRTICDHNQYLRVQLESYKAYLQNVRIQTARGKATELPTSGANSMLPAGSLSIRSDSKSSKSSSKHKNSMTGPIKFSHTQLEKDGVIVESGVPENRRSNIYFSIYSPIPGSFLISLHYKGRDKPIMEVEMQLDDLLEKQHDNVQLIDLEYVQLNVNKVLHMLNKSFLKR